MSETKIKQSLANLEKALAKLNDALSLENPDQLSIDGTIQRFEFTLELFWKTLKRILENEGVHTDTPKAVLKEAFQLGWLHNETAWLQMLNDRNQTSHVYDEKMAKRIYLDIKKYSPEMQTVFNEIKLRFF